MAIKKSKKSGETRARMIAKVDRVNGTLVDVFIHQQKTNQNGKRSWQLRNEDLRKESPFLSCKLRFSTTVLQITLLNYSIIAFLQQFC